MGVFGPAVEARGGGAVWPCGVDVGNWLVAVDRTQGHGKVVVMHGEYGPTGADVQVVVVCSEGDGSE